ncbi:MAG: hypothetical protein IJJ85_00800 [Clostridia bacterium]|nr:hypothetical protein [Clostridia bacterium]
MDDYSYSAYPSYPSPPSPAKKRRRQLPALPFIILSAVLAVLLVAETVILLPPALRTDPESDAVSVPAAVTDAPTEQPSLPAEPTTAVPGETPTEPAASLSDVYRDHFAMRGKNLGPSKTLTGKVELLLVYVSTPQCPWTQEQKDKVHAVSASSVRYMQQEAARYGADLELKIGEFDCDIPLEIPPFQMTGISTRWYDATLDALFQMHSMDDVQRHYEAKLHMDDTPFLFMFNSWDRSFTINAKNPANESKEEYSVFFCDTDMHDNYLTHELLHQYGAIDYYDYDNEGVKALADKYFPDSLMDEPSHTIDPLTAYLIGWTDELTPDCIRFLDESQGLR